MGSPLERRRERIELRETTRSAAVAMVVTSVVGAAVIGIVAMAALQHASSLLVRAAVGLGVTLPVAVVMASVVGAVRRRSRRFVLELDPERPGPRDPGGPSGLAILRDGSGALLGKTSDGSLRIQHGRYWRTSQGRSGYQPALVLTAQSGLVLSFPAIGSLQLQESSPDIGPPTMPHLYPKEFLYLARLVQPG